MGGPPLPPKLSVNRIAALCKPLVVQTLTAARHCLKAANRAPAAQVVLPAELPLRAVVHPAGGTGHPVRSCPAVVRPVPIRRVPARAFARASLHAAFGSYAWSAAASTGPPSTGREAPAESVHSPFRVRPWPA